MLARNHIFALVVGAALLSTTSAPAQTEKKLFNGVSTYHLSIDTSTTCGLSKEFIRKKALFPLSFSDLSESVSVFTDIWIHVSILADTMPGSEDRCYGAITVTSMAMLWQSQIPFNNTKKVSETSLFRRASIFLGHDTDFIGDKVEDYMKELVTTINLDNK